MEFSEFFFSRLLLCWDLNFTKEYVKKATSNCTSALNLLHLLVE
jgi:hypothetical protein